MSILSVVPFIIAGGTCFIKFSIVLSMVKNALGIQQAPSSLTLNGVALILTAFVMMPVCEHISAYIENNHIDINSTTGLSRVFDQGLASYREYLVHYSDPNLIRFFDKVHQHQETQSVVPVSDPELINLPLITLMPAYALSEIQSAFKIAFYLYVPFVVIDMIVSSVLLALGMMMMSPVTISVPIKLILFVSMNGWALLTKGLIGQYADLMTT